jgi:hypothetical protein
MGAFSGPERNVSLQTTSGRSLYSLGVVQDGLVLNLDASKFYSYPRSGNTWTDLSSNGNTGTLVNGPTYSSGNGGALTFDGVDDYGSTPSLFLFSGTKVFTFEIWVNFTSITGNFGNINKCAWLFAGGTGSGSGQPEFGVYSANNTSFTPNTINFGRGSGGTIGSLSINVSSLMSNGNWYQIVLVRSASNAQTVYLNASSIGTGNVSNSFSNGQPDFGALHGNPSYEGYLNGKISTIKIYNRALTATEIAQNFNATRSRFGI